MPGGRALAVATVCRSLALQSPEMWQVLAGRGYAVTFVAARDEWTETLLARHPTASFEECRTERRLGLALVGVARQLRALSRRDWDLVQVQSPIVSAVWRAVATSAARGRTVYVVHGFHFQPGETGWRAVAARAVETVLARRTLALATVSEADLRFVRHLPALLRPKVVAALPGAGVDVDQLEEDRSRPEGAPEHAYAVFVGDLNANKDPMSAVAAVAEHRRRGGHLHLVIIGEGPLHDRVTAAVREHTWIHHVLRTHEVGRWLSNAAVLLAPSHREGLPRVIIEALAVGTPVVARSNRGSTELLAQGVGVLLPDSARGAWAEAIARSLETPPDREAMRARALTYGSDRFRRAYEGLVSQVEQHARRPGSRGAT